MWAPGYGPSVYKFQVKRLWNKWLPIFFYARDGGAMCRLDSTLSGAIEIGGRHPCDKRGRHRSMSEFKRTEAGLRELHDQIQALQAKDGDWLSRYDLLKKIEASWLFPHRWTRVNDGHSSRSAPSIWKPKWKSLNCEKPKRTLLQKSHDTGAFAFPHM